MTDATLVSDAEMASAVLCDAGSPAPTTATAEVESYEARAARLSAEGEGYVQTEEDVGNPSTDAVLN